MNLAGGRILRGDMSIVGPRPLAVLHYERDRQQGNVTRFLVKGGLLGLGHINKGTPEMGKPAYEYEYIDQYVKRSALGLLMLDLSELWNIRAFFRDYTSRKQPETAQTAKGFG